MRNCEASKPLSIVVKVCGFVAAVVLAAACGSSSPKAEPPTTSAVPRSSTTAHMPPRSMTTVAVPARSTTPSPPPPGVSGRIELPLSTLVAGSTEKGTFVIVNNTDAPLALTTSGPVACKPGWGVILTSPQLPQEAAFADSCLPRPMVVPIGENRLPFTLRSDYQTCSESGHAENALTPACVKDANGLDASPPLPPGEYRATFFSDISRFIPVESVPVQVVTRAG
jgi:hypothetical protein